MKNLGDFIKVYDNVLSKSACETMIKIFDDNKDNPNYSRTSDYEWETDYRRFQEVNTHRIDEAKEFMNSFYSRIDSVYNHYKKAVDNPFLPSDQDSYTKEFARIKKYEANGKDQFGWHADVGDGYSCTRFLVFFTYLNDVTEGGETAFQGLDNLEIKITPKCGRMVVFPPMWMFPHKGLQPISNDKYIVSTYLHYL